MRGRGDRSVATPVARGEHRARGDAGLLAAALAGVGRGWSIVPVHEVRLDGRCSCGRATCPSPGKHPRIRWERYQHERADESTVRDWWRRWPHANVGVVTGAVSSVLVLDVDPRNGGDETLAVLEATHGALPPTPAAYTGGGGLHAYLRHPGGVVPSRSLGPGLDLQAEGSVVVCPPSLHSSGRRYVWEPGASPDEIEPATAPFWVLDPAARDAARPRVALVPEGPRSVREREEFARLWEAVGVTLEPGDRYYRCPFHDDHHPSLHVDAQGCRWYCFGCRRGGGPGMLRRLVRRRVPREVPPAPASPAGLPAEASWLRWPGLAPGGLQRVVGEAACVDALEAVAGGRTWAGPRRGLVTAELVPDDANPYDPQAVRVEVGGLTVGWIPRADAPRVRSALEVIARAGLPPTARARLTGGWDRGPRGRGHLGVVLDVAPALVPTERTEPFIPSGRDVTVAIDAEAQERLEELLGDAAARRVTAILEAVSPAAGAGPEVTVRVGGQAAGRLSPTAASAYAPLVRAVHDAGLPTTCAGVVRRGARGPRLTCSLPTPRESTFMGQKDHL